MKVRTFNIKNDSEVSVDISTLFHVEDLPLWKSLAKDIAKKFADVFIFGVGGSSLAGQVLMQFASKNSPKVTFIDTIDEDMMSSIKKTPINTTAFVFITKSGETLETMFQANYCLNFLQNANLLFKEHCFILTMKDTPLWNFAKAHEIQTISHPDVSGRFSCFTAVAIFPALIAGVNVESYIDGGRWQSNKMLNQSFSNAMLKDDIHIIMPYTQKLSVFTEWYSQLTAESLSKNGKGYCVVRALGTKDQHNQLQMFLDGKNNKTYTFIGVNKKNANVVANTIDNISVPNAGLSCIMQAGMHGVAHELAQQGKCVRIIEFEEMTPSEVGKLFVFYMQEVLHQASILNVEPFTQPAVASVKKLMFEFLTKE